jgi:hypothetical protein
MAAEIGKDQAIARGEFFRNRHPEFVVCGKGMEENNGRAVTKSPINNFGVITA